MRHLHDHIGKTIGHAALSLSGPTEVEAVIAPDARRADLRHDPDPARDAERALLGLLGRMASFVCLLELYSGAPDVDDGIACLMKLIAFRQQRQREADRQREEWKERLSKEPLPPPATFVSPRCWIVAARHPVAALAMFGATLAPSWPRGVYFGTGVLFGAEGVLHIGIVDASELPRERSTLLVRFLAAGPLLAGAIADLALLEEGAPERAVAENVLVDLEHVLGAKPGPTPEEMEFVVSMQGNWADARRIGRDEGRTEGRLEEAARAVLTVLRVRGVSVSDSVRERILAEKDPARLDRWLERATLAASAAEVFDARNGAA
jgi:post-segregation antitoxin (ccd killing protein)